MADASLIPELLKMLSDRADEDSVFNPYRSQALLDNVEGYFRALIEYPYSGDLLVGEAPGYNGCALTGIPFTSEDIVTTSNHPFIVATRSRWMCSGTQKELTATLVWGCLSSGKRLPAFWNAFPFHPHDEGDVRSNRKPSAREIQFGATVLAHIIKVLAPRRVFAVGRPAEDCLRGQLRSSMPYLRHPSNRGVREFQAEMRAHGIT
jgi:hypothetical protein